MTELRQALELAFDYRGDVTITRKDGARVEGYIFDRRNGATLGGVGGARDSEGLTREDLDCVL